MDIADLSDNIISRRWKERCANLPDDKRKKLETFEHSDYQLQVIKRKRIYPQPGDIFQINPREDIYFYGIVVNNHINSINGDDLLVVMIFCNDVDIQECIQKGVRAENLLIPPQIVGKEYWTRGYFYNVKRFDGVLDINNYGFYKIGKRKFVDEYGNEIHCEPELLEVYGVATVTGIARMVTQELIIRGMI